MLTHPFLIFFGNNNHMEKVTFIFIPDIKEEFKVYLTQFLERIPPQNKKSKLVVAI